MCGMNFLGHDYYTNLPTIVSLDRVYENIKVDISVNPMATVCLMRKRNRQAIYAVFSLHYLYMLVIGALLYYSNGYLGVWYSCVSNYSRCC